MNSLHLFFPSQRKIMPFLSAWDSLFQLWSRTLAILSFLNFSFILWHLQTYSSSSCFKNKTISQCCLIVVTTLGYFPFTVRFFQSLQIDFTSSSTHASHYLCYWTCFWMYHYWLSNCQNKRLLIFPSLYIWHYSLLILKFFSLQKLHSGFPTFVIIYVHYYWHVSNEIFSSYIYHLLYISFHLSTSMPHDENMLPFWTLSFNGSIIYPTQKFVG